MEHVAALLLIIGCSGGTTECRELPAPVALYETMEECRSSLPRAIGPAIRSTDEVYANCVSVDPALAEEDAELVWDITDAGQLVAAVEPVKGDVMLAQAQPIQSQE